MISQTSRYLHFLDKCGIRVGEDISLLTSQRAAGDVEVDPKVGVVSFYRHTDVLKKKKKYQEILNKPEKKLRDSSKNQEAGRQLQVTSAYLDGGDVKRCGDAEDGHDDSLILLVDEDLHVSDVLFSGHLRHVLIGHV